MVGEEDDDDESEGAGGKEEGNGRYIKNSLGPDEETISAARGRLAKHFGKSGHVYLFFSGPGVGWLAGSKPICPIEKVYFISKTF